MKTMKENYAKLADEYENLRASYDQQVEKTMALESKLRDLARETAGREKCFKCLWDALSDTCSFDIGPDTRLVRR